MEELKKIAEDLNAKNEELRISIELKADNKIIEELKSNISAMQKQMDDQNIEIQESKKVKPNKNVSNVETIKSFLLENANGLKDLKATKGAMAVNFEFKTVGNITTANISGGNLPVEQREPGLNPIATRRPFILDLITRGAASSNLISWVEMKARGGAANLTTEGSPKNQIDFDFVVASETIKKITAYIKVSEEMLEDVDFLASEINNELLLQVALKIDQQILNGAHTGGELMGLTHVATAYSTGAFANSITDANNWDVLKTAINQVIIAEFTPNYIVMNPSDVTAMGLSKDDNGQYILPPFQSAEGMSISGVRIIANTGMTIDKFLVMDGTKATTFFKNDIRIEVGRDASDFINNMVTVLAEARLLNRVKSNDAGAFVYGDFSDAKAALLTS